MPLYEYQCQSCAERVEMIQRVSDPPYSHCPKCGGEMKKLLSAPAIQFKGSGFYKTDYANTTSKADTKKETTTETKSDTKSDTKKTGSSES
jgi:putative FmdB family regulatory protein